MFEKKLSYLHNKHFDNEFSENFTFWTCLVFVENPSIIFIYIKRQGLFLPVSCVGTALDNMARIIGRDMSLKIPRITDKYICQDCHVKARVKVLPRDDVTDIIAITASENPESLNICV
jgi:hypothetical protein